MPGRVTNTQKPVGSYRDSDLELTYTLTPTANSSSRHDSRPDWDPGRTIRGPADHQTPAQGEEGLTGTGWRRPEISAGCQRKDKEGQALGKERR